VDVSLYDENNAIAEAGRSRRIYSRVALARDNESLAGDTFAAGSVLRVSWDADGIARIAWMSRRTAANRGISSLRTSPRLMVRSSESPAGSVAGMPLRIRALDRPGIETLGGMFAIERPRCPNYVLADPASSLRPVGTVIDDPAGRMAG
jgi:hypothetical protein